MPAQRLAHPLQQHGQVGAVAQHRAHPARFGQPVADLAQIARTAAARDQPPQRAPDIGRLPQHRAQIGAQQRIGVEMVDAGQPLFDRAAIRQRGGQVLGQLARARAGGAAVDAGDQAAGAPAALRFEDFEAGPRRCIHRQMRARPARDRWQQERQSPAPGMVEIGDQARRRGQHRARKIAQPVERGDPVDRLEPRLAILAAEIGARPGDHVGGGSVPVIGCDHFARAHPCQRRIERIGGALLQLHPPGRDIAGRQPHPVAHRGNRHQQIGAARFEQRFLGQRAGGDETHDIARHQRLGHRRPVAPGAFLRFLGCLGLFGDRDAAAALDQPREIALGGMHRHAAHRYRFPAMFAARGERDIEHARRNPRILEEQFEEVAHAVEQQRIAGLALEREILLHHRSGRVGHGAGPSERARDWGVAAAPFPL